MNPALWISKTGVQAQDAKLQAIANNLANVNTVGFKRDRVVFEDLFYQVDRQPGAPAGDNTTSPSGVQRGNGTRMVGTQKIFTSGNLQATGNSMDVAIVGRGFLQATNANGEAVYTRAGQLQLDGTGRVVTPQGLPLQPEIVIPADALDISISDTGVLSAIGGDGQINDLGQLTLTTFVNPAGLLALGDNLYSETVASGAPTEGAAGTAGFGVFKASTLEGSNVQVVEEMVDMIAAQRTYEMNTKVLSAADNMMQYLAQAVR